MTETNLSMLFWKIKSVANTVTGTKIHGVGGTPSFIIEFRRII
jgi:hypothetical protein